MKRETSLFVMLLHPPSVSSFTRIVRWRGSLSTHPSLAREGVFPFVDTPPPPPPPRSLETQDGGGFLLLTHLCPLPRSKREMEGVFYLLTRHHHHHHHPLPRSKCETEGGGVSFVNTPPPSPPLPHSKRETEGVFFSTHHHHLHPPSSLELRDGGVLCQHTLFTPPSLALLFRDTRNPTSPPLPHTVEGMALLPFLNVTWGHGEGQKPSPSFFNANGGGKTLSAFFSMQIGEEATPPWTFVFCFWFPCSRAARRFNTLILVFLNVFVHILKSVQLLVVTTFIKYVIPT